MKLLLFDIDGTILHTNGAGRSAIEQGLSQLCGNPITTEGIAFSGKTDPQILHDILDRNGYDPAATPSLVDEALSLYETTAHAAFDPDGVDCLPGIRHLLPRLDAHEAVQLGLLTGNVESMAYRKLAAVELDHHFGFGAFGSDHALRQRLPSVAVMRARIHTGHSFTGHDVVIIGDTEHDICCGREIGAFSVGVCTGDYDRDALAIHDPDVLLDDLSDTEHFVETVLGVL